MADTGLVGIEALGGERVQVRGIDGRAVAAEVGEAHIISEDDDDVRLFRRLENRSGEEIGGNVGFHGRSLFDFHKYVRLILKGGDAEFPLLAVFLDGELHLVIGEDVVVEGLLFLAHEFARGDGARAVGEPVGDDRLGDFGEKAVGVLVVHPFPEILRRGAGGEEMDGAGDGQQGGLVINAEDEDGAFFREGIEDEGVTHADHGMTNQFLLGVLENEIGFGGVECAAEECDERQGEEFHGGFVHDSGDDASFRLGFEFVETGAHLSEASFLRGIVDEVVFLKWIFRDVEELLEIVLRPEKVFPILPDKRLGGGNEILILERGVLVEELGAPVVHAVSEVEWGEIAALHRGGSREAGGGENGGGEIHVECESIVGRSTFGGRHTRIADDERDADAFLVGIPFVGETMLAVKVAVVGSEDDKGVVVNALAFQLGNDLTANGVHFGGETVVVPHHLLVFAGLVEAPCPAVATFVLCVEKVWEFFPGSIGGGFRDGDGGILVEFHALRLR